MSYTKRQFVLAAFEEIGKASHVFDLQPEDLQSALKRLDAMIAKWQGQGIKLGYPMPTSPELSDLDTETNAPDSANETIITSLAIRLAPSFGKTVTRETKTTAKQGYDILLAKAAVPPKMNFPMTLPVGAGNRSRLGDRSKYFNRVNNEDKSDDFENLEFID